MTDIRQVAPDPQPLRDIIDGLDYKDGWEFSIVDDLDRGQGSEGMTLVIRVATPDSYANRGVIHVAHYHPVPPAGYNVHAWRRRWLLERIIETEVHEACEFFTVDGDKPFAPHHGPGSNPYTIHDRGKPTGDRERAI